MSFRASWVGMSVARGENLDDRLPSACTRFLFAPTLQALATHSK